MISEATDAASRALTGKTATDQARVIPPAVAARGQSAALDYLGRIGATPEQLLAAKANAFGKPITTAEAVGPTGISQATGLARRAGTTPQVADAAMKARSGDRMSRILGDIHETTGVDPEAAKGNIDTIVQNGRQAAAPLFDAVRAQGGPVTSPELESILGTPAGKQATTNAVSDLQNARIDPRAHGFVLGTPTAPATAPLPEPSADDLASALSDIKESRSTPTGGLFRAIQQLGGMKLTDSAGNRLTVGPDVGPFLAGRKVPGLINNRTGMSPEYMAQALQDRGWFEPNVEDPTQAFEEALDSHARGSPVYKPGAVAPDAAARAQGFDQEAQASGVLDADHPALAARKLATLRNADAQERAAIQSESGSDPFGAEFDRLSAPLVSVQGLTPHALDLVRQNLGGMVERDQFGRIIPDSQSRGNFNVNQVRGDLTDVLAGTPDQPGLIPGYRHALDTAGDYLSIKGAYDRAQGRLFGTSGPANDPRSFDAYFQGLKPGEQDATRASLANDIFTKLNNGQLGPGSFNAPAVQQKLSTVFGPDPAQDLIAKMKVEADMSAAGARMQPNLNSTTGDVIGSQADQGGAQAAFGLARAGVNALSGRPIAAAHGLASAAAPFVSAARQPFDMASRNALGDILYSDPAATAAQLSSRINAISPTPLDTPPPRSITALQNAFAVLAAHQGDVTDSDQPNQ
jgi:hypothetical protein